MLLCTQEILPAVGGSYSAGSGALNGVAHIPEGSSKGAVEVDINDNVGRVWAVEMAALHKATQNLAQTRLALTQSTIPLSALPCSAIKETSTFLTCA